MRLWIKKCVLMHLLFLFGLLFLGGQSGNILREPSGTFIWMLVT
jgi:hypothetical protein